MENTYYLQKDRGYYTHDSIDNSLGYGGNANIGESEHILQITSEKRSFYITSPYQFDGIEIQDGAEESEIIKLIFQSRINITHTASVLGGASLYLERGENYYTSSQDVIYFKYDGTYWQEINHLTLLMPAEDIYLFPYGEIAEEGSELIPYNIFVKETKGLTELPDTKKMFQRDWKDEQGLDVWFPKYTLFKEREITVTFVMLKTSNVDFKNQLREFLNYFFSGGEINYFDTFKSEGFRGYLNKTKVNKEYYREYKTYIEFELNFIAPNGICYGFDNSGQSSIFVNMIRGTADFYFSDGTSQLNISEDFVHNQDGGFCIVCPSTLGGAIVKMRKNKIFCTSEGKLLGTDLGLNYKIYGI